MDTLNTLQEIDDTEMDQVFNCSVNDFSKLVKIDSTDFKIISQNISVYFNFDDLQLKLAQLK